jgi:hypothetical protein
MLARALHTLNLAVNIPRYYFIVNSQKVFQGSFKTAN